MLKNIPTIICITNRLNGFKGVTYVRFIVIHLHIGTKYFFGKGG